MRHFRHATSILVTVAIGALALAGCGSSGAGSGESSGSSGGSISASGAKLRIGALYLDSQGFYAGVKKGVQDAAAEAGTQVDLVESNSGGDVSKESSFMNTLVASGVDAIIIAAVSTDGSVNAVRQAAEAGIPVICYNTCVNNDAISKYVKAYVVGDPYEFGRMAGDYAGKFYKEKSISAPKFGVINCEQYEVCQTREKGFESGLNAVLPDAKVVSNQEGAQSDTAVTVGEQILTANPEINGLYGQAGGATVGAFRSIASKNKVGTVFAFGSDMTTEIATELASGKTLQAVVDISGIDVGGLAFQAALDAIDGKESAEVEVKAPIKLYTPSDAQAWLTSHPDGLP